MTGPVHQTRIKNPISRTVPVPSGPSPEIVLIIDAIRNLKQNILNGATKNLAEIPDGQLMIRFNGLCSDRAFSKMSTSVIDEFKGIYNAFKDRNLISRSDCEFGSFLNYVAQLAPESLNGKAIPTLVEEYFKRRQGQDRHSCSPNPGFMWDPFEPRPARSGHFFPEFEEVEENHIGELFSTVKIDGQATFQTLINSQNQLGDRDSIERVRLMQCLISDGGLACSDAIAFIRDRVSKFNKSTLTGLSENNNSPAGTQENPPLTPQADRKLPTLSISKLLSPILYVFTSLFSWFSGSTKTSPATSPPASDFGVSQSTGSSDMESASSMPDPASSRISFGVSKPTTSSSSSRRDPIIISMRPEAHSPFRPNSGMSLPNSLPGHKSYIRAQRHQDALDSANAIDKALKDRGLLHESLVTILRQIESDELIKQAIEFGSNSRDRTPLEIINNFISKNGTSQASLTVNTAELYTRHSVLVAIKDAMESLGDNNIRAHRALLKDYLSHVQNQPTRKIWFFSPEPEVFPNLTKLKDALIDESLSLQAQHYNSKARR